MNETAKQYLGQIAKDVNLEEGVNGIKRILVELHRSATMSLRDLAEATRFPPPVVSLVLNKLSNDGMVHRDKFGARYTEQGMKYVEMELGIMSLSTVACDGCDGTGFELDPEGRHSRLFESLEEIVSARPNADVTLDQAKCTVDTLARRLLLLHAWHAFDGTSILFLGDDDFVSISSCIPEFTMDYFITDPLNQKPPFQATVLDIDDRIIAKINELAKGMMVRNLAARQDDVRQPLPADLRHAFDVVFTDPPYTVNGCKLFLSRAIDALKAERGSRIFLSFGHLPPFTMQTLQKMILDAGLSIEALYPAFNRYEGGNIIGNMSQLMVLSAGANVQPPHATDQAFSDSVYTATNEPQHVD
nr:bis-aminopropyl spermidine synthase family protein [Candidatus Sigynarchaeota archaeon]